MIICIAKPEFTKAQIADCRQCKHASAKIKWCGKHACWIGDEQPKIITPGKDIKLPSMLRMGATFSAETAKYLAAGAPNRPESEQARLKSICQSCKQPSGKPMLFMDPKKGPRCRKCGCCTSLATLWATKHCPLGKW